MSKNSDLRSPNTNDHKIIKVIFAFFSISLLLFGGNLLMVSYSQSNVLSQVQELSPQLQQPQLQQQAPSVNMTKLLPGNPPSSQQQDSSKPEANEEPCDGVYFGAGKCM